MSALPAERNLHAILAPPKGRVARKWSMFVMLGEPGFPQRHTEALFAGAVGAGKSRALVAWLLLRAFNYPGIRLALVRDTLANLKRSTLKTLFEAANGGIAEDHNAYNEKEHFAYLSKRDDVVKFGNGSEIHLFGVKDSKALDRLVGTEWGGIGIDQLERVPKRAYVEIVPRARQYVTHQETGEVVWPMVKATANLNEKRTSWVARRFLYENPTKPLAKADLADEVREMYVENVIDGKTYHTWRAYFRVGVGENESVNPHYMKVLAGVAQDIGGFLTDEWQEDLEQIFVHEWDGSQLIDDSFSLPPDLEEYDLYVGLDWGWGASPTVAIYGLWHRQREELYIDREYVEYSRDINDYGADIAADMADYAQRGVRSIRIFADPSLWNRSGFGFTAAEVFLDIFRKRVPATRIIMAPAFKRGTLRVNDKARVDTAKRLMRERRMKISRSGAPQTIEVLSTVVWGDVSRDHHPVTDIFDSTVYMTMNIPLRKRKEDPGDEERIPVADERPPTFHDWRY